jgi:5-methylthioadenosine/S-adenosylhomocysteine deaminase
MNTDTQVIHAKWIYTGERNQPLLSAHALIVQDGRIDDIISSSMADKNYPDAATTRKTNHLLMPGFINGHTHLGMNYFRGLANDLPLMEWLTQHIFPTEKKWLSHELVHDASRFAIAEMIRSGTTCFNDMFYFPEATAEATDKSGMRGFMSIHVLEFPTPWAATPAECFTKGLAFHEAYQHHPLISTTFAPHAPYTVADESFIRVRELSEKMGLKINLHLHETMDEINQSLTQYQKRPIKRLHDLGLLSSQLMAIHCANLNEEDLAIIRATHLNIVHCPESNLKLASGKCPVETLQSFGINVALGTDSVASNNDLDMITEMRAANFLAKSISMNPVSMSAKQALQLATINGAKALGMDNEIGSLTLGKAADFIAIDLDQIETLPTYEPISQVVYASGRHQVTDVWVAGKALMQNRQLLTIDEAEVKEKAKYWGERIRG